MAKRLKTYRLDPGECDDFAWAVSITGDTETDVIREAIVAYIQRVRTGRAASPAPVAESVVYTPAEAPARHEGPREEPACKHPAEYVDAGECRKCGAEVW